MQVVVKVNQNSVWRVQERLKQKCAAAFRAGCAIEQKEAELATGLAKEFVMVASGQSRDAIHAYEGRTNGAEFVTGLAVTRLANGQEVMAEAGRIRGLHTSADEHDPRGRLCSSGDAGGWGAGDEPENPRGSRPAQANPRARFGAIGAAIWERIGPVIDLRAAKRFQKGLVNHYPGLGAFANMTRMAERLKRAGREEIGK